MPHPLFSSLQFVYKSTKPRRWDTVTPLGGTISILYLARWRSFEILCHVIDFADGTLRIVTTAPFLHESIPSLPTAETIQCDSVEIQPAVTFKHLPVRTTIIGTLDTSLPSVKSCAHCPLLSVCADLRPAEGAFFRFCAPNTVPARYIRMCR